MSFSLIKKFKKFIYGTIPYLYLKAFKPLSPKLNYYKYIKEYDYTRHIYEFARSYIKMPVHIQEDKFRGLYYVMHNGVKKLYFPGNYSAQKITNLYRALLIEQDTAHPHHYIDSLSEIENKTILDVGAAEGMFSLNAVETARMIYLFEYDSNWIEALKATFEPWKEKVILVKRFISNKNGATNQTLDDFFSDKSKDDLFLKMDIEGAECKALEGSKKLFSEAVNLNFAICTYHRRNDKHKISAYLNNYSCTYAPREGYMYVKHRLRTGLIRGFKA